MFFLDEEHDEFRGGENWTKKLGNSEMKGGGKGTGKIGWKRKYGPMIRDDICKSPLGICNQTLVLSLHCPLHLLTLTLFTSFTLGYISRPVGQLAPPFISLARCHCHTIQLYSPSKCPPSSTAHISLRMPSFPSPNSVSSPPQFICHLLTLKNFPYPNSAKGKKI
jgi:hypothetical protein